MERIVPKVVVVSKTKLYRDMISDIIINSGINMKVAPFAASEKAISFLRNRRDIKAAFFVLEKAIMDQVKDMGLIKSKFRHIHLAIIVDTEDRRYAMAALQAGMHGHIPISLNLNEFTKAVTTVCLGQVYMPPSIAHPPSACKISLTTNGTNTSHFLTPRQQEIVALIRAGMKNKEIAEKLGLTESTIKVHNYNIFRKLGAIKRSDFID